MEPGGEHHGRMRRRRADVLLAGLLALFAVLAPASSAQASYGAAGWGANLTRQLGDGSNSASSATPVPVSGLTGVTAISAGGYHSLALLAGGTVLAWGENEYGQLGDGATTTSGVPVAVSGLSGVTAVAAGGGHSLALLANGTVMAWGDDSYDQLANNTVEEASNLPVPVLGLSGVASIAAGANHNLARLTGGTVMAWGANARGQLGDGATAIRDETPTAVGGLSAVTAIAAGGARSMALLGDGTVRTWGDGASGALGSGAAGGLSKTPVAVKGLGQVAGISAGARHDLSFGAPLPVITGVSPASGGSTGGTAVTISGANFTAATAVRFGAKAATGFTVGSSGSIAAVAPAGTPAAVNVTVTTPAGVSPIRPADRFTYLPAPAIARVAPNVGPAGGGTTVTITGTGFTGATAVSFGASPAAGFLVNSATSITAVSPAGAAGLADIRITTPVATSAASARDHFKYIPSIESLTPNAGPVAGGVLITVTGSGFSTAAKATTIKFGTKRSIQVECSSSTTCTTTAPAHEAAVVDVIATVNGESSLANPPGDSFTYG